MQILTKENKRQMSERKYFGTETVEEKTRKYTRPHHIVTSHLHNLQNGFQVAPPVWRNTMSVRVPHIYPPPRLPPALMNVQSPLPAYHSPTQTPPRRHSNNNRKRQHGPSNNDRYAKQRRINDFQRDERPPSFSTDETKEPADKFSREIMDYSREHEQSIETLQKKQNLRSALLSVFRNQFPTSSLHLVGSSCNGFATNQSDADFCVMITQSRQVDQRVEACWYLKQLQKLLRSMSCIRNLQFIRAKVPILKFKDTISGVECDINLNNSIGIRNTHLLRTYSKVDERVRPLIMIIKHWAKSRQINDASQGTLSSYSLVLLVIHFLQTSCQPPVLSVLQQEYPDFFSLERNVDDLPMFEPADLIPCNQSENKQPLSELLIAFFKYYAVDFKWAFLAISIRLGRATPKTLVPEWRDKYICIEEPFDRSNTARAVHEYSRFKLIQKEFNRAHEKMKQKPTLDGLIT